MADADWLPGGARWWEGGTGYRRYAGYRVAGGIGGVAFEWQELTSAAVRLESAAATIGDLWRQLLSVQMLLADPRWTLLPERWAAETAVQAAAESLAALADSADALAGRVQLAHGTYLATEQAVSAALQAVDSATWWATVPLGMAANEGRPTRAGGERLLGRFPAAVAGTLGGPAAGTLLRDGRHGGPWNNPAAEHMAPLLVAAARQAGLLRAGAIEVKRAAAAAEEIDPAPASLAGLLHRTASADRAGDGTVEVLEVSAPGRQKRWIVALPGTQAAGSAEATGNPFDETGIAEAVSGGSPFVSAAVSQALGQAGAGAEDLVMLVGYSQGGIHAMNLAADPAFLAGHNVGFVLTAGSPVAGINPGPGVRSVHLEHARDWVPGTDARPNPDRREQVTVTLTDPAATPAGEGAGLGPGHDLGNYVRAARNIDASPDPSVRDATAFLGAALAGGTAKQHLFTLRRSQPDGSKPSRAGIPGHRKGPQPAGRGGPG